MNGPGRPLNNPIYLALIPKDTLRKTIENGRPGTAMPAWARSQGGPLSPKQITALVDGIEKNWAKPVHFNGIPLPSYSGNGESGDKLRGKLLFARDCFMCHGPGAMVGPVTDPSFLALATDQVLRTSIIVGRSDLGMPDWRFLNAGRPLNNQEVSDLVAYLASLRPATAINSGARVTENGTGQTGPRTKGNEGSGYGPGSPRQRTNENNKPYGSNSSQRGIK